MLTFEPNAVVQRDDYDNIDSLRTALNGPQSAHDNVHARLFVVEDLSRDVIEALGARFDVDPLFFRGHISDYMWHNTRDPWVELPDLDLVSRQRSYLHVRYVQTKYFRSEDSLKKAQWEAGGFNVLRRVDKDGNWVKDVDIPNSDVGLVRSRTSFWIRPNKSGENGVLGESRLPSNSPIASYFWDQDADPALDQASSWLTLPFQKGFLSGAATVTSSTAHP